jgi:hypothetical protein
LLPENEEGFRKVFDQEFSAAKERELQKLISFADDLEDAVRLSKADLKETLRFLDDNLDVEPLVIVAHSEDEGRVLVLTDGTRIKAEDFHGECEKRHMTCVILTCDGPDLDISGEINAGTALYIWSSVYSNRHRAKTTEEFVALMAADHTLRQIRGRATVTIFVGGPVLGASYLLCEEPEGVSESEVSSPTSRRESRTTPPLRLRQDILDRKACAYYELSYLYPECRRWRIRFG